MMNKKNCVNCEHYCDSLRGDVCQYGEYETYINNEITGRRTKITLNRYVKNDYDCFKCERARTDDNLCGNDAKWFEKRKTLIERLKDLFNL